ncbi:MAG: MFS transporter [Pseudomonadota bacterium]
MNNTAQPAITNSQWKIILLSSLGGMLEFYDFVIFVIFAKAIGQTFFPNKTPLLSIMATFTAFAIGYLARPIGGFIFSHFGDKYGRKHSFLLTITLMGSATLLMGLLPSYQTYGIAMSVIFLLLRIIQGIAVGGEIPGAITFVSEHVPKKIAFSCAVLFLAINMGIVLGDAVYAVLHAVFKTNITNDTTWRFAFILGGFLAIISYIARAKLEESPEYLRFENAIVRVPLLTLFKSHPHNSIFGIFVVAIQATMVSLIYLYTPQYMQLSGHYSHSQIALVSLFGVTLFSLLCVFWGWLADFIGAKKILTVGCLTLFIFSYIYYDAIIHHHKVFSSMIVLSFFTSMVTGTFSSILPRLFPVIIRYSGIAFCYNLGFAIFGGLSPLMATYLIHTSKNMLSPILIIIVVAVLGLIGTIFSRYVTQQN